MLGIIKKLLLKKGEENQLTIPKKDLIDAEELSKLVKQLELNYEGKLRVSCISAAQRKGTKELVRDIGRYLETISG